MQGSFFTYLKNTISETFTGAAKHNVGLHGAAIAFYTIFSVAPLIILILALITFVLGEQQTTQIFTEYLEQLLGPDIAASLIEISQESRRQSSGFWASIIATALLLFGATTVITQLKNSLNTIWEITPPDTNSILQFFLNRLISLVTIFLLTLLFLASLLLEGGLTFFEGVFLTYVTDAVVPVLTLISHLLSVLVTVLFFTLIFRILPDINARWKDIFVGACVTTVLFLAGKYLIGLYLGNSSMEESYKTAGSFIIFLIWMYYNVQIVLLGAEFTRVYADRFGKDIVAASTTETFG